MSEGEPTIPEVEACATCLRPLPAYSAAARAHHDLSWPCRDGAHERCADPTFHDSRLLDATGFHWFCACTCHPEPRSDFSAEALVVWFRARLRFVLAATGRPDRETGR